MEDAGALDRLARADERAEAEQHLQRKINWTGAFWVASGVPCLVLFSIGAIAATVGKPSWLVWVISISFGFIQAFTYAEIAGLFPDKAGGASVYGAQAWLRYGKFIAPISVWCNWLAWSPVLTIGSGLAAGYVLSALFAPDAAINTWKITLLDLSAIKSGLELRINATFLLGTAILFTMFAVQHGGILRSARFTMILGISALVPLMLIALVPILTGDMAAPNFFPIVPIAKDAAGYVTEGAWNMAGITLMAGGLFIAAWSTYAFETSVCYTREFKDPKSDTFKAIFFSGLLCVAVFTLVPLAFQGYFGLGELVTPAVVDDEGNVVAPAVYGGILSPDIASGMGVANKMAQMVGGGPVIQNVIIIMLILALALSIMTAMGGSSRTIYQASVDGWLPRYLSRCNVHGAPTHALYTDLTFNMLLLLMSDYVFVLAASNVNYIIFNFLNLNSGWIHRIDRPNWERPFRCPTWLLGLGACLSFVNLTIMGLGADVWGEGTLISGVLLASLILPVFLFRHYIQDKGVFPKVSEEVEDIHMGKEEAVTKRAGMLPYIALVAGVIVVFVAHSFSVL